MRVDHFRHHCMDATEAFTYEGWRIEIVAMAGATSTSCSHSDRNVTVDLD
jgi:hypothetical protein